MPHSRLQKTNTNIAGTVKQSNSTGISGNVATSLAIEKDCEDQHQTGSPSLPEEAAGITPAPKEKDNGEVSGGKLVSCCLPSGCPLGQQRGALIDEERPGDAVAVRCNNPSCQLCGWMHVGCFREWEGSVLGYLRTCGRARSWSEKQRLQNLWTKRGYDLAYKACDCRCRKGHLKKDLDHYVRQEPVKAGIGNSKYSAAVQQQQQPPQVDEMVKSKKQLQKKGTTAEKTASRPLSAGGSSNNITGSNGGSNKLAGNAWQQQVPNDTNMVAISSESATINGAPESDGYRGKKPALRVRTSSLSSGYSSASCSPSSSTGSGGTPPLTPSDSTSGAEGSGSVNGPSGVGEKNDHRAIAEPQLLGPSYSSSFDFFANAEQAAMGCIFRRRRDFGAFAAGVPRYRQNPYNIKTEDEGPHGNDEIRCFVLTNLSAHRAVDVGCAVCGDRLPVYDKYPLLDGAFFLSPLRYPGNDIRVQFDGRSLYLNAACMRCLQGQCRGGGTLTWLECLACQRPWNGSCLVIGTMYAYDIFAAMPCCVGRTGCKSCGGIIVDSSSAYTYFSDYSKSVKCPHCQEQGYHFVKPLEKIFAVRKYGGNAGADIRQY